MVNRGVEDVALFQLAQPGEMVRRTANDDWIAARRLEHDRAPLPCELPCGQDGRHCAMRDREG
eukprot:3755329-Lingulodinium_polyedra.AAC.1